VAVPALCGQEDEEERRDQRRLEAAAEASHEFGGISLKRVCVGFRDSSGRSRVVSWTVKSAGGNSQTAKAVLALSHEIKVGEWIDPFFILI